MIFAFALLVGQSRYSTNDDSAILVTVSEDLNIIIPNSAKGPATYINVPLDHIDSAIIDSRANSQSQTPSHILVMKLSNDDGTTCYLNASKNASNQIALVFAMENDAKTLMRLIQLETVDEKKARHYSQSEAIDVSQVFPDDNSQGELAVQSPRKSQELSIMATQAASFPSRSPPARTSHSTLGVVSTISRRPVSKGRPDQESTDAAQYVERSISVAMGVDVSQPTSQSNTQTDARSLRGPVEGDIGNQRKLRTFDRTIGTGLSSSLRRKKANDINENAPESCNPDGNLAEQQAAEFSSRDEHTEDYDSTYEVSPKKRTDWPGPVQLKPLPPQLLRSSNGNVDDHRHTDRGLNSEAQEIPAISPGAIAASRPQQSRKSKLPIILPNAGDNPTNRAPTKLSRRLRNIEGGLGNDTGPLVDPESHSSVETGAQEKKKLQNIPKRKATVPTKSQGGIQKQAKPAKKLAVKKGKIKAHADRLSDKGDEFDLEASPGPTGTVEDAAKAPIKTHVRSQVQSPRGPYSNAEISIARSGPKALDLGSKAPLKAKASKARAQKDDGPEEKSIWELPRLASIEPHRDTQHKGAKQANVQSLSAPKEKKASRPPAKSKPKSKPRSGPAPAAPMQPRFRRAAAIKANKKIQGLEDGDEITDVDDPRTEAPTNKSSVAAEKTGNASVVTARINGGLAEDESTAHASPVPQPPAQRPKFAGVAKNNIKIDATDCKQRNPALESEVDSSSPEKIDLVQESLVPPSNLTHKDTRTNEPSDHTDPVVPPIQKAIVQGDLPTQGSKRCANDDTAHGHIQERDAQSKPPLVPSNVRKVQVEIPDTEESIASDIISGHYLDQEKIGMIGDMEDSHFQEAMPEIEGRSFHPDQAQKSLDIAAGTLYSNKLSSVGSSLRHKHGGKIGVDSRDNQHQAEDPFKTKLGPLVPKASVSTDQHLAVQSLDTTQMLKGQKTLQAKPIDEIQDKPVVQLRETKGTTNATKALPIKAEAQHVRLPRSVALPNNDLSGPAPGEKRSMDDDYRAQGKVAKVRTYTSTDVHAKANGSTKTETPFPIVSLKPGLISWTVSGPGNQGTISAKKIHAIKPIKGTPIVEPNDKTGIAPFLNDPASGQYDQHTQRQVGAHMTPRHDPKHVPPMRPKLDVSIIHERAHRLCSQSTKVDENGSPMPFIDQSRQVAQHGAKPGDFQFAFKDDEIPAAEDVHNTYAPQSPMIMNNMVLGMNDLAFASISSNRKQIPSSPHAASTHATIPPHVILHSGELVNERTLESIVPTLPQDPFVGGNPRPPSSFMNLLHKSAAEEKRRRSGDHNKGRLSAMVKRKPSIEEDDPDTTLVEPEPKRQKKHHYIVPESSSTSDPTSRAKTPAEDWSDQESDSTTMQWQKSLEPHQSNMLEILSHITHVKTLERRDLFGLCANSKCSDWCDIWLARRLPQKTLSMITKREATVSFRVTIKDVDKI